VGNDLYVANSDAVLRFPYAAGDTRITVAGWRNTLVSTTLFGFFAYAAVDNRVRARMYQPRVIAADPLQEIAGWCRVFCNVPWLSTHQSLMFQFDSTPYIRFAIRWGFSTASLNSAASRPESQLWVVICNSK
jgi:hypothetical protein